MIDLHVRKPYLIFVPKKEILASINLVAANILPDEKIGVGILICSDNEIHELNKRYRQIDMPTDVLSFGIEEIIPETQERYLGDIIISYETAKKQSLSMGHSALTEIKILLIHGFLHLLGYDHHAIPQKKEMWNKQIECLGLLGIQVTSFSGEHD